MRHLILLTTLVTGCASSQDIAGLQASLDELGKQQQQCLTHLETLQKDVLALRSQQVEMAKMLDNAGRPAPARPQRPRRPDPDIVHAFPVGDAPVRGSAEAWVTIVEVSDFQCPYCKRVNATLQQLLDKYGDDLRLVFKHNPLGFHKNAMPAAIAAECAHEQGRFWEMHDLLFENQRALEPDDIEGYARQAGQIDMAAWRRCVEQKTPEAKIEADQKMATGFGARGTPSFFINGRFLSGAQPAASFEKLIDEELLKARASGLPRSAYYDIAVVEKGEKPE